MAGWSTNPCTVAPGAAGMPAIAGLGSSVDIGAWAKNLQEKIASQDISPDSLLPPPVSEGPPAKVAKLSFEAAALQNPPAQQSQPSQAAAPAESTERKMVIGPESHIDSKKAHWAQVFATFQQTGQTAKACEHAKSLGDLRKAMKEAYEKYKKVLETEDELLQTAYGQALEEYRRLNPEATEQEQVAQQAAAEDFAAAAAYQQQAIEMQVQAHQELETSGYELRKSVDSAHQLASRTAGEYEQTRDAKGNKGPKKKLPQRPCMLPCAFFMKTGDCAYGAGCKWDHPDRGHNGPGCFHCQGAHVARDCPGGNPGYN